MTKKIRFQIVLSLLITVILFACFILFQSINAKTVKEDPSTISRYESVLVYEGDSVWSIAKAHRSSASEAELYAYVDEIKSINHISGADTIYAGNYLIIPIYEDSSAF